MIRKAPLQLLKTCLSTKMHLLKSLISIDTLLHAKQIIFFKWALIFIYFCSTGDEPSLLRAMQEPCPQSKQIILSFKLFMPKNEANATDCHLDVPDSSNVKVPKAEHIIFPGGQLLPLLSHSGHCVTARIRKPGNRQSLPVLQPPIQSSTKVPRLHWSSPIQLFKEPHTVTRL
jgi:hypothetical protein